MVVSAFWGLDGSPSNWMGAKVLPSAFPGDPYGAQMLGEHVQHENPDLVITLCDIWVLNPDVLRGLPVAHWLPVDCEPLSARDEACLRGSGAVPIAMSRFGERMLRDAGFDPLYVPHSLGPAFRKFAPRRDLAREQLGVTGKFVIGMNVANKDPYRKGMYEQLDAFGRLLRDHPDCVMLIHGLINEPGSLNLQAMIRRLGLGDEVRFVDQYALLTGQVPMEHLVSWYGALDLYSACSLGEGFGLTILEAQAMGIPVVTTAASATLELCGAGWTVGGEPFWNGTHESRWVKPYIGEIHSVYERVYKMARDGAPEYVGLKEKAREFSAAYHAERVLQDYWVPALVALEERFAARMAPALTPPAEAAAGQ